MRMTLLLLAVLLFAGWFYLRRRKLSDAETKAKVQASKRLSGSENADSRFHAVSIKFPQTACDAAKDLEGQRFLASEAPRLPLPNCARSSRCECRFQHYSDRRSGRDRRSPFASGGTAASTGKFEKERRQKQGRRKDD